LDEELEALQQEELDNRMLSTGHVPVGDKVGAMPSAPQGGKFVICDFNIIKLTNTQ
jgi:hypothetical protein